ncbi:hypothetical protein, partial [Paenibacillus odorifer]|uniref:hypothetical protein n=1 Tax=Paenibacillus odorifer TaxID=189426 RepID=UPI001C4C9B6E
LIKSYAVRNSGKMSELAEIAALRSVTPIAVIIFAQTVADFHCERTYRQLRFTNDNRVCNFCSNGRGLLLRAYLSAASAPVTTTPVY